jgi:hypothetical protein
MGMTVTTCDGGRGDRLVGRTAAMDHHAALGGSYEVEGGREGVVNVEVLAATAATTR